MLKINILIILGVFHLTCINAQTNFKDVDDYALKAPTQREQNIDSLTKYLTEPFTDDFSKVRSIYIWITNHIDYDVRTFCKNKNIDISPANTLKKSKTICTGYANLFKTICEKAGIQCEIIEGYSKGFNYVQGDIFISSDHCWNAVLINNKWYLIDPTWGSGYLYFEDHKFLKFLSSVFDFPYIKHIIAFKKAVNENYFLTNPNQFVLDHLPLNPQWQLLNCPITIETFEKRKDQIELEQKNTGVIPCYSFNDSITHYNRMDERTSFLEKGKDANLFNVKNKKCIGDAYIYLASQSIDKEIPNEKKKDEYELATDNLKKAKDYFTAFKESINKKYKIAADRNKAMHISRNKENENHAANDFRLIKKNKRIILRNKKEKKQLKKENKKLNYQNRKLASESIEEVKKRKKSNTPEETKMIEDLFLKIKSNKEKINFNKSSISNLCRNNKEERELFINKNIQSILDNNKKNAELFNLNISMKIMNDHQFDTLLNKNKCLINENKKTESELRIINEQENQVLIDENLTNIKNLYKENKNLIKENKKLIRKLKSLSPSDRKENELFIDENKSLIDDNNAMIASNKSIIVNTIDDNKILKQENKMLKTEILQLFTENDLENIRFKFERSDIQKQFNYEMNENNFRLSKCKEKLKFLNKEKLKFKNN